jgi:anti-sigma factor RsiW
MTTIHDEIDELLAADLHEQLSETERNELHAHLVECPECRQLHKEHQLMNTMLNDTFEEAKPDLKFEQRVLGRFRDRVPDRGPGVMRFLLLAMRSRATQIAAVAAVLLALVQTGRMITGEGTMPSGPRLELAARDAAHMQPAPANPATTGGFTDRVAKAASGSGARSSFAPPPPLPPSVAQNRAAQSLEAAAPAKSELHTKRAAADEKKDISGAQESVAVAPAESAAEPGGKVEAYSTGPERVPAAPVSDNRKLVRNAEVELEVRSFDEAVQKITGFAAEDHGYVGTTNSEKQENGKLRGQIVVKVLPENLDRFVGKLRGLGDLKNQSLTTEDVTKQYFDTDSRLKTARAMEERLLEILKRKSQDINDLLAVEKELGRVREQIEQMQGELKFMDTQVQFATVTIQLAEKDMNVPAAFLLKERAQLALFAPEVEKTYNDIKALASSKVQITNATLDRENSGRVSARISMLIAPEESDGVVAKAKSMGRVENFQVQTERVAHGGEGMSENAKTERDKVELNISISREEQEPSIQQTTLSIRTADVNDRTKQLRTVSEKQNGRIRSSSFSRDPNGREFANVSLRVPMKNYSALMQALNSLGRVENVSVTRQDRPDAQIDEQNAPADVSIQVYSQGNIVSQDTGLFATLRRTIAQGAAALMWSVRMIGVALAFFAPWVLAIAAAVWIVSRVRRTRRARRDAGN